MKTLSERWSRPVRLAARGLSAVILLFWGFFLTAHLFGDGETGTGSLTASDYIQLILMGAWLLGLLLAWKWELLGGAMACAAWTVFGLVNPAAFRLPFPVLFLAGALFLLSWWLNRTVPPADPPEVQNS